MSAFDFVIDTDSYVGNFDRILAAFLTGISPNQALVTTHVTRALKCSRDDLDADSDQESPFWDLLEKREVSRKGILLEDFWGIRPTPGWSNDGKGRTYKVSATAPFKHDSYQSLVLFMRRQPTSEEVKLLQFRLKKYPRCLPRIGREFAEGLMFKPLRVSLYTSSSRLIQEY